MIFRKLSLAAVVTAPIVLSGCGSLLNPAGSSEYGCPGMPMGVTCKTPAAVYKSTHGETEQTEFDTAFGRAGEAAARTSKAQKAEQGAPASAGAPAAHQRMSIKPVREPARVARIWIAPWVDKNDNLNLASFQYTEIKPRTWTVGVPESKSASGYVIPHRAFDAIEGRQQGRGGAQEQRNRRAGDVPPPGAGEPLADPTPPGLSTSAAREAQDIVPPPN